MKNNWFSKKKNALLLMPLMVLGFFACKPDEIVNPIDEAKKDRDAIHGYYQDSLPNSYKTEFSSLLPVKPIFSDTTRYGRTAVVNWMGAMGQDPNNPTNPVAKRLMTFDGMLDNYVNKHPGM